MLLSTFVPAFTRSALASVVVCFSAAIGAASPGATADGVLAYERIAKDYAARVGVDAKALDSISLDEVLAQRYVRASLGAFEMFWPGFEVEKQPGEMKACVEALLHAQETWLDWVQTTAAEQKTLREDLKAVAKWAKSWQPANLAKAKPGTDLLVHMAATPTVAEAAKRLADAMQKTTPLGTPRESPHPVQIVFQPTRQDFTEFVYFVGLITPDDRALFWLDSTPDWTQCFVGDRTIVALQYTIGGRAPNDYTGGTWMNERDEKVMQQQVVQLAMNALFLDHYKDRVPGAFVGGLSMNLVIDAYGLVNTRVDGDTRGRFAGKREMFVPGGASEGGTLPKNSAETRWREKYGSDHFLSILRSAQKDGGDLAKDEKIKVACFAVRDDSGGGKFLVTAPFFGAAASGAKAPPDLFQGDFLEFLRAYKSAFIYWLQNKAVGPERPSRDKFALLLHKLADPNASTDFEALFKDVYDGAPLSAPIVDKECLEGRFLIWLAKQK